MHARGSLKERGITHPSSWLFNHFPRGGGGRTVAPAVPLRQPLMRGRHGNEFLYLSALPLSTRRLIEIVRVSRYCCATHILLTCQIGGRIISSELMDSASSWRSGTAAVGLRRSSRRPLAGDGWQPCWSTEQRALEDNPAAQRAFDTVRVRDVGECAPAGSANSSRRRERMSPESKAHSMRTRRERRVPNTPKLSPERRLCTSGSWWWKCSSWTCGAEWGGTRHKTGGPLGTVRAGPSPNRCTIATCHRSRGRWNSGSQQQQRPDLPASSANNVTHKISLLSSHVNCYSKIMII